MKNEIELSVDLDKKQYQQLHRYLSSKYKKVASQKRFMVRFFVGKVDVREPLDIRYKWTDGHNQLVIKKGALGSQSREETTIDLGQENQLDHFVKMFQLIGFRNMIAVYREMEKFVTPRLEISLNTAAPYFFMEVESLDGRSKNQALSDINNFYNEIKLKPLNRASYQSFLRKLDREVNYIFPINHFPQALLKEPKWEEILKATILSKKRRVLL
jgi:adenylate cyclase class IV